MASSVIKRDVAVTTSGREATINVTSKNQVVTMEITPQGTIDSQHPAISMDIRADKLGVYFNTGSGWTGPKYFTADNA